MLRINSFTLTLCYGALCLMIGCSNQSGTIYPSQNVGQTSTSAGDTSAATDEMEVLSAHIAAPTVPVSRMEPMKTRQAATPSIQTSKPTQSPRAEGTVAPTEEKSSLKLADAPINIFGPGDGSRVISPIQVEAHLTSNTGRSLRVELRGSDGRLLARVLKIPNVFPWPDADISIPIFFEINDPEEHGRLSVSVDDKYGRPMDANTVELTLISSGPPLLQPNSHMEQAIVIQDPSAGSIVKGGTVQVSGLVRADLNMPLNIELVSVDGSNFGFRLAAFSQTDDGGYGNFSAGVPYSATHHIPVRLIVYSNGMGVNERNHLSSTEIVLSP